MGMAYPIVMDHRTIRALDIILSVWTVLWIGIALVVGFEIHGLTRISDTLVASSDVLEETGVVVSSLQDIPVVGDRVENVEREIGRAATSTRDSGEASRRNILTLSVLLGVAIASLPTVPVLSIYIPLRISWEREVRTVRRALSDAGDDPSFKKLLATRAVERLPFHRLAALVDNPWGALERGDYEALSRAELDRLGVAPPEQPSQTPS